MNDMMGKRVYCRPTLVSEKFVADIFCAACYSLACTYGVEGVLDVNAPNKSSYYKHTKNNNNGSGCGHANNQRFRISDDGKIEVVELNAPNTNEGEELPCIFTGELPEDATGPFEVEWTTYHRGLGFTYTHKGIVNLKNDNKSGNHS